VPELLIVPPELIKFKVWSTAFIVPPELLFIVLVEPLLKSIENPVPVLVIEPLFIRVSPSSNRTVLEELTAVITPPILLFTDNPVDVPVEIIVRPLVALSVPELLIVPPELIKFKVWSTAFIVPPELLFIVLVEPFLISTLRSPVVDMVPELLSVKLVELASTFTVLLFPDECTMLAPALLVTVTPFF
jgi:hypothetical protein